ncbi:MAG: hypothetical protein ACFE9Z_13720 [Promethearchaeota archaeon]
MDHLACDYLWCISNNHNYFHYTILVSNFIFLFTRYN